MRGRNSSEPFLLSSFFLRVEPFRQQYGLRLTALSWTSSCYDLSYGYHILRQSQNVTGQPTRTSKRYTFSLGNVSLIVGFIASRTIRYRFVRLSKFRPTTGVRSPVPGEPLSWSYCSSSSSSSLSGALRPRSTLQLRGHLLL